MTTFNVTTLIVDEDTGVLTLNLRNYEPEEFMTFESLLFLALANKISTDAEWCEALVSDAEQQAMSDTTVH